MKEKLIFVAEVAAIFAVIAAVQMHVFQVPVIGAYLPGGKPATA